MCKTPDVAVTRETGRPARAVRRLVGVHHLLASDWYSADGVKVKVCWTAGSRVEAMHHG